MRAIFISYRREDAEGQAGRLYADLVEHFGEDTVFMDVVDIEPGSDFRKAIDEQVSTCGVLLAVIGKDWLDAKDISGGRRLEDPADFVRLETASALRRKIPVIPVLVRGASLPRPDQLPEDLADLVYRNAVELTHARWDSDLHVLIKALRPHVEPEGQGKSRFGKPLAGWTSRGEAPTSWLRLRRSEIPVDRRTEAAARSQTTLWVAMLSLGALAFSLLFLYLPRPGGNRGDLFSPASAPFLGQKESFACRPFLVIGKVMNWKILHKKGIVNAGTLQVISINKSAGEWEVEQITQTKANAKVFLKGTFSDTMIALNRGDAEKWLGECKEDRILGHIKTTYAPDMSFEIQ